ncbi:MAG: hypothetical protein R2854_09915 [Caldilineaceae bacterium]
MAGALRLAYAQFEELRSSRFSTRLDEQARHTLARSPGAPCSSSP